MSDTSAPRIRAKDRDVVLQCLRSGVVPTRAQYLIQVGRAAELKALIADVERVADGGSAFRLVVGAYGSGKTFFLNLVRGVALEKRLVTLHADLTPQHRLHASGGEAQALYAQLVVNMATRNKPEGGALASVVERFVATAHDEATKRGVPTETAILERLAALRELPGGYDFASVIAAYWRGHETGDDALKGSAIRWLRGEFTTKTDARQALGVRTYVDDAAFYDQLKLLSRFVRLAGYGGLLVCLDEMVNLYKIGSGTARKANYERILGMLNDCLQGSVEGLGFILGGTPEFVMDPKKGLYSYGALESRLAENTFKRDGLVDFSGPVIRLSALSPEDLFVLLTKVRHVHALADPAKHLVPDDGLHAFMHHCQERIGEAYFRTPRSTLKAFTDLLAILEQNPGVTWQEQLGHVDIAPEGNPDLATPDDLEPADSAPRRDDDELTSLRL